MTEATLSQISKKQQEFFNAYLSGKYSIYALGGGTGSGKTIAILLLFDWICKKAPGVRIGIFRKSEKNLKLSTIPSFYKAMRYSGTTGVVVRDMKAKYPNGSEILFLWADITKDVDTDNVKGSEFTLVYFNEANQVSQKYYEISKTRIGRWNEITYEDKSKGKVKPSIFVDFNPNQEWPKTEFYDKHMNNELPEDVFFQLTLPKDNPFRDRATDKLLESLPESDYNRYVLGLWDYADNPSQLIIYEWYKNCMITEEDLAIVMESEDWKGRTILAIDPKDEGKDKCAFVYMKNKTIFKIEMFARLDEILAAHKAKEKIKEYGIIDSDVIIDVIGVGAGTGNTLKHDGIEITKFNAASSPESEHEFYKYLNKRAEAAWLLRMAMQSTEIVIVHSPETQRQLLVIRFKTEGKVIQVEAKKEIRKRLGYSPDIYDGIAMANYKRIHDNTAIYEDLDNIVEIEGDLMAQYKDL